MTIKKIVKISLGIVVFLTLPSLLFFGFVYFKYNEELPTGIAGPQADSLAHNMLEALNYEAYKNTNYIEWSFKNRRHYQWQKNKHTCTVRWKDYKVQLHLNHPDSSKVFVHNFEIQGEQASEHIKTALGYFNNDSFWLVAPYKVFDPGTERQLIPLDNNQQGLLVTYTSGGTTPGDSYLWILDANNKPIKFRMWVQILPIGGLEASWNNWTTTESGALLPTFHQFLFLGIKLNNVVGK
ncbi:hypothetical protein ACFSQP_10315 [Bizionia sediminis]|uniref:DUF3108 domain-containing protein n=1 Tax=Bizionia sediminis TaxID=1737064 RepID=A0ABW5KTL8_9FLAO